MVLVCVFRAATLSDRSDLHFSLVPLTRWVNDCSCPFTSIRSGAHRAADSTQASASLESGLGLCCSTQCTQSGRPSPRRGGQALAVPPAPPPLSPGASSPQALSHSLLPGASPRLSSTSPPQRPLPAPPGAPVKLFSGRTPSSLLCTPSHCRALRAAVTR